MKHEEKRKPQTIELATATVHVPDLQSDIYSEIQQGSENVLQSAMFDKESSTVEWQKTKELSLDNASTIPQLRGISKSQYSPQEFFGSSTDNAGLVGKRINDERTSSPQERYKGRQQNGESSNSNEEDASRGSSLSILSTGVRSTIDHAHKWDFKNQNRTPTPLEIRECTPWLQMEFDEVQPVCVLALGATAKGVHDSIETNAQWVYARHPAYILRRRSELDKFKKDVDHAIRIAFAVSADSSSDSSSDNDSDEDAAVATQFEWGEPAPHAKYLAVDTEFVVRAGFDACYVCGKPAVVVARKLVRSVQQQIDAFCRRRP